MAECPAWDCRGPSSQVRKITLEEIKVKKPFEPYYSKFVEFAEDGTDFHIYSLDKNQKIKSREFSLDELNYFKYLKSSLNLVSTMDYFDIRIDLSGLPESEQEEIKKILAIPFEMVTVALLPIGIPDEKPGPRSRKDFTSIFYDEEYGKSLNI